MHHSFPTKLDGQRWQAETVFSMIRRRQSDAVNTIHHHAQARALTLKVFTHNIMIIRRHRGGVLQSVIVSYSDGSTQRVTLRSAGLQQAELRAFPIEYLEDGRECVVQVLYTTISGGPLSEMPAAASLDGITTRVESWSTRQFGSDGVWQLGRLAVRLDTGETGYPVQICLTAENGLSTSVTIPGPSSVGSR